MSGKPRVAKGGIWNRRQSAQVPKAHSQGGMAVVVDTAVPVARDPPKPHLWEVLIGYTPVAVLVAPALGFHRWAPLLDTSPSFTPWVLPDSVPLLTFCTPSFPAFLLLSTYGGTHQLSHALPNPDSFVVYRVLQLRPLTL